MWYKKNCFYLIRLPLIINIIDAFYDYLFKYNTNKSNIQNFFSKNVCFFYNILKIKQLNFFIFL
ncbi:MAG: hypothetical protein EAZ85_11890 [Bacteroidetes bacterium]|nr:MAG: hypothetical protein EAZ85_11890 [Bacteroidota bacterium]